MITTTKLQYRVLGPVSVSSGQVGLGLGGKRQRLVLAVLLANLNQVITQDSLVDAVWDGAAPERGSRVLHSYVSTLRKTLGGAIEREGAGYVLRADPGSVDAERFEVLVSEARTHADADPERASQLLREALRLWTGPAYGDLGYETALMAEAVRLSEARVGALETRFTVDLMLGRHEQVTSEIEALLQEHPYREHLAATLMLALYRSGRQAEALRVYGRMRERLVEELGIEPGSELQELELRILDADPRLDVPRPITSGDQVRGARGYEVTDLIGETRVGSRYRGFQGTMGREVSVLVLGPTVSGTPNFARRFNSGMQLVADLSHPHLAPVLDFWRDPDGAHVVTSFYRGGTVQTSLEDGPWSLPLAVKLTDQLCSALSYLHRQGLSHGSVNAATVLLDEEKNAYLSDTGLADFVEGGPAIGVASDVFDAGSLIYLILTGRPPDGRTTVNSLRSDIPGEIEHAVARALHPEPDRRFQRIADFARAVRQSVGLDVAPVIDSPLDVDRRNPYKGLRAFQEPDAPDFHGRDVLVEEMVEAMASSRFLAVVGPSGSGKSSAVRAGLLPRLRAGAAPGSEQWLITDMFPGTHPFEEMEAALLRIAVHRPGDLYEVLVADARGLSRAVKQSIPDEGEALIVVDQFEELFSLTASATDRKLFLDALVAAASDERSRVRVVVTMRADFFDQPLKFPEFADVLRANLVTVSPPTADALARVVSQPALGVGVTLEPGLVTRIVDDVRQEPGGLPLLQYALTELFTQREGDVLTLAGYEATGGVAGALARRAETIYSSSTPEGKEAARQLFLRLVTVDELADDTRRRVRQTELFGLETEPGVMQAVIQQFGAYRLLSFDRDAESRTPTVELAHEALLVEWARLRTWIDERREDLLIHRRLQVDVHDWGAEPEDNSYLLRGSRLEQALAWLERTDMAVSQEERRLIDESVAQEETETAERAAMERKSEQRRKAAIRIFAGAAVVATVLGIYALDQRGTAIDRASEASARELSQASLVIAEDDPELGILLAVEALEMNADAGREPMPEAMAALWSAYTGNRTERLIPDGGTAAIAYHPDGSELATDSIVGDGWVVTIREPESGSEIARLPTPPEDIGVAVDAIEYSPDGKWIAVTRYGAAGDQRGTLMVYDAATRQPVHRIAGEADEYLAPSFSGTGLISAAETWFSDDVLTVNLLVLDLEGRNPPSRWEWTATPNEASRYFDVHEFRPGTTLSILGAARPDDSYWVVALDTATMKVAREFQIEFEPVSLDVSADGGYVAISSGTVVTVYDLETQEQRFTPVTHPDAQALSWSRDGSLIAISGNESDITIIDAVNGQTLHVLSGHGASVFSTAFDPDGSRVASTSWDGSVRIWSLSSADRLDGAIAVEGGPNWWRFFVTDEHVVVNTLGGTKVFDRTDGLVVASLDPDFVGMWFAGDAGLLSGYKDGAAQVVEVMTGDVVYDSPCLGPSGISPDGRFVALNSSASGRLADCPQLEKSGIYDLATGDLLVDHGRLDNMFVAFSGEETFDGGRYAAVTIIQGTDTRVEVWQLDPVSPVATIPNAVVNGLPFLLPRFSSDARYVTVGTSGPRVLAVDVEALSSGATVEDAVVFNKVVHTSNAPNAHITDDGLIATHGFDGFFRFWDLMTGELVREIEGRGSAGFGWHDFSPDFAHYYYHRGDGVIIDMPMDAQEMVRIALDSVTRSLTDDECSRYLHTDGCQP